MTTDIASHNPGRAFATYDLLDEITSAYGIGREEAHDGIHAFLGSLVEVVGDEAVVVATRPMRPELLDANPAGVDVNSWITITDEAADDVRASFAAVYGS